jgi:hypothetical protein
LDCLEASFQALLVELCIESKTNSVHRPTISRM